MSFSALAPELQPRLVAVQLDGPLADAATAELAERAAADSDECYGYFPAMQREGIDHDLPACQALVEAHPVQEMDELELGFNFLRMSLRRQEPLVQQGDDIFHLDSDAATALTGRLDTLGTAEAEQVWRLLLNMHPSHPRTLAYVDVNPTTVPIVPRDNYAYCPPESIPTEAVRTLAIPPRVGGVVLGLLFCSSQVLHSGRDDERGHFVAGYGRG
jgi:hypothetical protein